MNQEKDYHILLNKEKDGIKVFYSKGFDERADNHLMLISGMRTYFNEKLNIDLRLQIELLDEDDWVNIASEDIPYGLPYVNIENDIGCITLPATEKSVVTQGALAFEAVLPDYIKEMINKEGYSFREAATLFTDLIGYHEIGHVITRELKMMNLNPWVDEFMASFFAYAYMIEKINTYAKVGEAMTNVTYLGESQPAHTSLEDLDELYSNVGVENYDWYQKKFMKLAIAIYKEQGLDFVFKVKKAFAGEEVDTLTAFNRLGTIAPVLKKWPMI